MTTSPQNTAEIEAVFGNAPPDAQAAVPAPTMVGEWRRFGAFLKRPTPDDSGRAARPFEVLLRIYALDMAIMLVLISCAAIAIALGVELPETALAGMEFTPVLIALVVIVAPVMEELIFRSWLSGKPAQVLAWFAVVLAFGAVSIFGNEGAVPPWPFLIAGLAGVVLSLALLWRKPAWGWFTKGFPVFYWLSVLSFALVHLANFEEGGAVLLALVLPQFVLGTMLGYVRTRIGLWAAIALHAAHNATALTIASLAMTAG